MYFESLGLTDHIDLVYIVGNKIVQCISWMQGVSLLMGFIWLRSGILGIQ
jgi:hypothetical protein